VLTTGESGLGKSTLINTLFEDTLYQPKVIPEPGADRGRTVQIESINAGEYCATVGRCLPRAVFAHLPSCANVAEIEENGVRLKLTVVDTPGFGDFVNNEEW
jgi:septin 7